LLHAAQDPEEKSKAAHQSEDRDRLATVLRVDTVFLPQDELQQILQARIASVEETQGLDSDVKEDCDAEELEADRPRPHGATGEASRELVSGR
jgi:hypothetical protein